MNDGMPISMIRGEDENPSDRFVQRVVEALVADRRRRRRARLFAAAALVFFFFAGAGQMVFANASATAQSADETYAGLVTPSPLDGLLPE